jgi:hypothetical protein
VPDLELRRKAEGESAEVLKETRAIELERTRVNRSRALGEAHQGFT